MQQTLFNKINKQTCFLLFDVHLDDQNSQYNVTNLEGEDFRLKLKIEIIG